MSERRVAGVELGGTNIIAVVADGRTILARQQWPTGDDAAAVLGLVAAWLRQKQIEQAFEALGIASFGPLCLDRKSAEYGRILATPKPGWSGADVVGTLGGGLGCPSAGTLTSPARRAPKGSGAHQSTAKCMSI